MRSRSSRRPAPRTVRPGARPPGVSGGRAPGAPGGRTRRAGSEGRARDGAARRDEGGRRWGSGRAAPAQRRGPTAQRRTPAVPRSAEAVERLIDRQPWERLGPLLLAAGADVDTATRRLRAYVRDLVEWNRGASNLVARGDEPRL